MPYRRGPANGDRPNAGRPCATRGATRDTGFAPPYQRVWAATRDSIHHRSRALPRQCPRAPNIATQ
eukprot:2150441-Lingulodinium_polyedra.AAC.1